MDYFKLLLIGSIVLFLTLGICCADDINSTNATSQSDAGTFNELQNLINESSQGSAINLTKDYLSGEGDDFPEGIRINKSITINGNNHVIDANSKSRMFFVTSPSDVVINNIIFVNGKGDVYGGAYLSDFGGTINNCVFKDNSAFSGGAVLAVGAKINNSTFINNHAVDGGAVYQDKGSIYGCTFINNSANYGGAVYQLNSNIYDSTFINNHAVEGGAVYQQDSNVYNSVFENNAADVHGGAVYQESGNVYGSTFLNNHAGLDCDDICNASNHADMDEDDSLGLISSDSQNKIIDLDGNDAGNPIGLLILFLFVLSIRTKK